MDQLEEKERGRENSNGDRWSKSCLMGGKDHQAHVKIAGNLSGPP